MLTVRPKISNLTFQLFGRSLHPELFEIFAQRKIQRQDYRLDVSITSSGHVVCWTCAETNDTVLSEIACSSLQPLPSQRQLVQRPLDGQQCEHLVWHERVSYSSSFRLEPADPTRLAGIQDQLLATSDFEGLVYQFRSSGRMVYGGVSYIDIQSRQREVKLRVFHTYPDAYQVAISESSFRLLDAKSK